jgi:hypothetical protein
MTQSASAVLAQADLYTDGIDYVIIRLPPKAITVASGIVAEIGESFLALIADKDEVTLVIPAEAVDDFSKRLRDFAQSPKVYRLITFNVELDFDLIGFMALVSHALAEAGISILPVAAYSRDHILIPADQIDIAIQTLQQLKSAHQS